MAVVLITACVAIAAHVDNKRQAKKDREAAGGSGPGGLLAAPLSDDPAHDDPTAQTWYISPEELERALSPNPSVASDDTTAEDPDAAAAAAAGRRHRRHRRREPSVAPAPPYQRQPPADAPLPPPELLPPPPAYDDVIKADVTAS